MMKAGLSKGGGVRVGVGMVSKFGVTSRAFMEKVYPEKGFEEKVQLFLDLCNELNWNRRAIGERLGLHPTTVTRIMEDLKRLPLYYEVVDSLGRGVASFFDKQFGVSIFADYEFMAKEAKEQYLKAKAKKNMKAMNLWMKHLEVINKSRLDAYLVGIRLNQLEVESEGVKEEHAEIYREAIKEFGNEYEFKVE